MGGCLDQARFTVQELPWRRIDVSYKGTLMPFFAHNLIQASTLSNLKHQACEPDGCACSSASCTTVDMCKLALSEQGLHTCWQVTREWLNWEGEATVHHLVSLFLAMEEDPRVQHALH
jgi:hypothetical protein